MWTKPIIQSWITTRYMRKFEVLIRTYQPTQKDLFHMLAGMKTRLMVVGMYHRTYDILWNAFAYFKLLQDKLTVINVSEGNESVERRGIMFMEYCKQICFEMGKISEL
ncbi:hypothetical protein IAQ61_011218 [Plenodomus lingam]|nr:hypothetical protein IAQ61_011218 [Plenodomus lingam]